MNRSRIEWCDHTWNPITGCMHGCPYCYARKMVTRFSGNIKRNIMETKKFRMKDDLYILDEQFSEESDNYVLYPFGFAPTYHRYRFDYLDKLKMGNNVFVGAMADVFGEWIPEEWILEILELCKERPKHNYLFLTKNPSRYMELAAEGKLPMEKNFWYGSTITGPEDNFWWSEHHNTFVSIEPLLHPFEVVGSDAVKKVDWVIIGAETGHRKGKVVPEPEWIETIVEDSRTAGIPVFMKDSLIKIIGEENMLREFPEELKQKEASEKVKEKITGYCMECKKENKKTDMVAMIARVGRRGKSSTYGYMCKECFRHFCREHGVEIPELNGLEKAKENETDG